MVAIDAKKTDESWNVYTYGGRKDTGINVIEWAKKAEQIETKGGIQKRRNKGRTKD